MHDRALKPAAGVARAATATDPRGLPRVMRRWAGLGRRNPIGLIGLAGLLLVIGLAIFAGFVAPFDPTSQLTERLTPPNGIYWLGTDEFGRDVFSRVIWGTRISLYVGVIAVAIALVIGVTLGLVSGYYGGWADSIIMRFVDILFAFPTIVLAIAITGILGPSLTNATIAIGLVYAPVFARVMRGPVLSVVHLEYVQAARTVGASDGRIVWRHVFPNVTAPLIVQTTLALSTAILAEAALSFLGLGTQPPTPSWGTMLGTGRRFLELSPWVAIFPGVAIMLTVLAFNLLGDGLRDVLDPRLRGS
ncbi:MAG: ABC transporter permease [Chloroflexota bacterium]|nr:ABC transporter permease [Chloroflexota bacterium]